MTIVEQTRNRSGWPARATLKALEITPSSYYRWGRSQPGGNGRPRRSTSGRSVYEITDTEREAILAYAREHPDIRHRELAWRMLDEDVCAVSSSTVYRVLREANLVCRREPYVRRRSNRPTDAPTRPDERWQTDLRYTKVQGRNYYLLSFIDEYSRYVVFHELLTRMDGLTVSIAAQAAIDTLPEGCKPPTIQSDHGSCFIAHDYASTLRYAGVGQTLIRPHTPTDNGIIERFHRTFGEAYEQHDPADLTEARRTIATIIDRYNHERLHASLGYLPPIEAYRGDPEARRAERRRKLRTARAYRKQENLKLRQRTLALDAAENVSYSHAAPVPF